VAGVERHPHADRKYADHDLRVAKLISYVSQFMSLQPGDLITTGTPPGVGFARKPPVYLKAGDTIRASITKLGEQRQRVVNWWGSRT